MLLDLQGQTQQSPQSAGWNTPVVEPAQAFPFQNNAVIALRADNGLYLGRVNRGAEIDPIEASKPDSTSMYAQFTVTILSNNQIVLQDDRGLYLSRIGRSGGVMSIEAAKSSMDAYCQFTLMILG